MYFIYSICSYAYLYYMHPTDGKGSVQEAHFEPTTNWKPRVGAVYEESEVVNLGKITPYFMFDFPEWRGHCMEF